MLSRYVDTRGHSARPGFGPSAFLETTNCQCLL